jgi:hypothetical protein
MAVEPRIVEVHIATNRSKDWHEFLNPIPAVLHANSEARVECLKYYELSSRGNDETPPGICQNPMNRFYFNYEIDTLYMPLEDHCGIGIRGSFPDTELFFEKNDCGILDKIQRVAIEGARDHAVTVKYFSRGHTPQSIILVDRIPCGRSHSCQNNCRGPQCLITFADLKATLEFEKEKKISWVDLERIGMLRREKEFNSEWQSHFRGGFPCPGIQSRVLCRIKCHNERST